MIYTSQASAESAARMLDTQVGQAPAWVVREPAGWTVIRSWLRPQSSNVLDAYRMEAGA